MPKSTPPCLGAGSKQRDSSCPENQVGGNLCHEEKEGPAEEGEPPLGTRESDKTAVDWEGLA
jgi:hypothetical protein